MVVAACWAGDWLYGRARVLREEAGSYSNLSPAAWEVCGNLYLIRKLATQQPATLAPRVQRTFSRSISALQPRQLHSRGVTDTLATLLILS
eukprot:6193758-Pleurochrysis_carterae.AAC.3